MPKRREGESNPTGAQPVPKVGYKATAPPRRGPLSSNGMSGPTVMIFPWRVVIMKQSAAATAGSRCSGQMRATDDIF